MFFSSILFFITNVDSFFCCCCSVCSIVDLMFNISSAWTPIMPRLFELNGRYWMGGWNAFYWSVRPQFAVLDSPILATCRSLSRPFSLFLSYLKHSQWLCSCLCHVLIVFVAYSHAFMLCERVQSRNGPSSTVHKLKILMSLCDSVIILVLYMNCDKYQSPSAIATSPSSSLPHIFPTIFSTNLIKINRSLSEYVKFIIVQSPHRTRHCKLTFCCVFFLLLSWWCVLLFLFDNFRLSDNSKQHLNKLQNHISYNSIIELNVGPTLAWISSFVAND